MTYARRAEGHVNLDLPLDISKAMVTMTRGQEKQENVKEHWDSLATDERLDCAEVTHRDIWQRWLEIELLKKTLLPGGRCLDIGCGTGYAARRLAPQLGELVGLDYSEEMIKRARHADDDIPNPANLSFMTGDVLNLPSELKNGFDQAYCVRCLINILDRDKQGMALDGIAELIRPNGQLILIEGSAPGRQALDDARAAVGLERMPKVWHNLDFAPDWLQERLHSRFEVVDRRGFGTYDFVSRLVHPLLVEPEPPQYRAKINEAAAKAALHATDYETISRVIFLVLRKRPD